MGDEIFIMKYKTSCDVSADDLIHILSNVPKRMLQGRVESTFNASSLTHDELHSMITTRAHMLSTQRIVQTSHYSYSSESTKLERKLFKGVPIFRDLLLGALDVFVETSFALLVCTKIR